MADGTLKFDTKLDSKDLEKGLDNIEKKGKQATNEFDKGLDKNNKSLVSLSNTVKIAGGVIAGKLFKDALTMGVQFNAQVEQYTSTFATFTGSVEKANKVVQQLVDLGAKTPFQFPELAETTQILMSYGFSAEEAVKSLTMLGDASQGNAEKLTSIATGFARMKSSGKVTLEYLNLLIENGFNPLQQVAKDTGMSMAEIYDAISDGEITFDQIQKAMQTMTSKGGQYFGLMEKQSQTLNGKWSTLNDTFNTFLGKNLQPLNDFLRDTLIPSLIYFLENIEKFEPVFVIVGTIIGTVTALLIAYNIQQALATANLTLWGAICGVATTVTTALATAFAFLTSPIALIIIAIGALIAIIYLLVKNWDTVKKVALDCWNAIIDAWNKASEWFNQNVVEPIVEFFTKLWESISKGASDAWNSIVSVYESVAQWFYDNVFTPIYNFFMTWIYPIIAKVQEIISKIIEILVALVPFVKQWIAEQIVNPIVEKVTEMYKKVVDFITKIWESIVNTFSDAYNLVNTKIIQPVTNAVSSFFAKAQRFAQMTWDKITNIFSSVGQWFGKKFDDAYKSVTKAFSKIANFFGGIWDKIKNTFSKLGTSIGNAISGAVKGAINGLIGQIENTINTGVKLINGAIGIVNKLPGVDISKLDYLKMPRLERGGILRKGQMGFLEGNGAEAVVPLERNKYWVNAVAKEFAKIMPQMGSGQTINFYSTVATPDEVSRKLRIDARLGLIG